MIFQIERVGPSSIEGWIRLGEETSVPAELEIWADGVRKAAVCANLPTPGLPQTRSAMPANCGFRITDAQLGELHTAERIEILCCGIAIYRSRRVAQLSRQRMFFMHIPKTGGTSFNHVLSPLFESSYTHLENHESSNLKSLLNLKFPESMLLSGHLLFHAVDPIISALPRITSTILRDPYEHLISHLAWVYHVGFIDSQSHDPSGEISFAARRIATIDVESEISVVNWITGLTDSEAKLFYNLQTRYLGCNDVTSAAMPSHLDSAREALKSMDVVGRIERTENFARRMERVLGVQLGPVPRLRINESAVHFRKILKFSYLLRPLVELDQVIYQDVVSRETSFGRLITGWRRAIS